MPKDDDVVRLESAILERAAKLAEEYARQGKSGRRRILTTATEKLRLLEDRETLTAKARADREYRRLVQANEIRLRAELDSVRWALVQSVMQGVRDRLSALAADKARYRPVFEALLRDAAQAVGAEHMVAEVNTADHKLFLHDWQALTEAAAPGRQIDLLEPQRQYSGGVRVMDFERRVSVDNTFDGRMQRLGNDLYQVVLEWLFPSAVSLGG